MRYGVLGPLEVTDGKTVASLGPPKQRALLAVRFFTREEVHTDRVWWTCIGDSRPREPRHNR